MTIENNFTKFEACWSKMLHEEEQRKKENANALPLKPKHFSEITKKQMEAMWMRCVEAALYYADDINISALRDGQSHDVYTCLYNALDSEWEKSKKVMRDLTKQPYKEESDHAI